MVHFKDAGLVDALDAIRAAIEACPEDHNLVKAFGHGFAECIVDEPGSAKEATYDTGKLPISQGEKGGSNAGKAQQLDNRGPKGVLQETTGEAIFEEAIFPWTIRLDCPHGCCCQRR